jgi:uncharacterized glyoxalase superfamily protein PhnB
MTTQMFPVLVVENPEATALWYRERLGFQAVASLGWYEHLRDDQGHELGFLSPGQQNQVEPLRSTAASGGFAISFEVENLDTAWQTWGMHERVLLEPIREEWGQYHFMVFDVAGIVVDVIQAASAPD